MTARPTWLPPLEAMTDEQRDAVALELIDGLGPLRLHYCPITPHPVQEAFLRITSEEAFFGGAAGAGKTAVLLMAALQFVDVPGYSAILFRRSYTDLALPGGLMQTAQEWLSDTPAHWSAIDKTWTFPSGATLTFGYLQHEAQKYRYRSAEFQFLGFDEATELPESAVTYLFSRLRRARRNQGMSPDGLRLAFVPLRIRAASNPGGPGHDWVHDRWVDPETREPGVVFLPARMTDNPSLDVEAYRSTLARLGEVDRRRLELGDWDAQQQGSLFKRDFFLERSQPYVARARVRWWDFAATEESDTAHDPDHTATVLMALAQDGEFVVEHADQQRLSPAKVDDWYSQMHVTDDPDVVWWVPQDPGAAGKHMVRHWVKLAPGRIVRGKIEREWAVKSGDRSAKEVKAGPTSAAAEHQLIRLARGAWHRVFLREVTRFPDGPHDDLVDAFVGAHRVLAERAGRKVVGQSVRDRRLPGGSAAGRVVVPHR